MIDFKLSKNGSIDELKLNIDLIDECEIDRYIWYRGS